jgi:hypothetical protein
MLSIEVKILEQTVTANHPARLRISTTNYGPKRALSIGTGHCRIFNRWDSHSNPVGLTLVSSNVSQVNSDSEVDNTIGRKGNRWEADLPQVASPGYRMYKCPPIAFDSGESVSDDYSVWHDYRVDGYLNPGIYRWAQDIRVWDDLSQGSDEPSTIFSWGFELSIEKP